MITDRILGDAPAFQHRRWRDSFQGRAGERREATFRLQGELYQAIAATIAKLGAADAAWVAADRDHCYFGTRNRR